MSIHIMVGNGRGWESRGRDVAGVSIGHAEDAIGFYAGPFGLVVMEPGTELVCRTRAQCKAVNEGMHAAGWISETNHDLRIHPCGATVEIERHGQDADGKFWARFYRVD